MKFARTLAGAFCLVAGFVPAGSGIQSLAQQPASQTPAPPLVNADKLIVQPEEMATVGRILGDTSKPGIYVTRARFAPGRGTRPHYHDQDRFVTVIKGTWWTASGNVYQPDKMTPIKTGGFMYHPAGYHHYDMAKDEEVVVQIIGMGPVKTVQTEVDANGQPVGGRGGR